MPYRKRLVDAHNIDDLRSLARRALPRGLFDFVDRGSEDELSLQRTRTAFDATCFQPKVLVDVSGRSAQTQLFGLPAAMPVAIAPAGAAGLLAFGGEIAVARAARQAGIPFVLSTASIVSMERVAQQAGGTLWFQLYMLPERAMSYRLLDRVQAAGYETLIVTVDTPVSPNREYNMRNGFSLPMRISRRNAWDVMRHPGWFFRVFARYLMRDGIPMLENYPDELRQKLMPTPGKRWSLPRTDALNWDDLRDLRRRWPGRLMVKGILRPDDAALAVECGADAVIVSNHGGRNLDSAMPPLLALPAVVDRIGARADVWLDSGIRRGSDVVKALALGARGVLVGRAPLWGVAAAGEPGAFHALKLLREEIERTLGLLGCVRIDDLDASILAPGASCKRCCSRCVRRKSS